MKTQINQEISDFKNYYQSLNEKDKVKIRNKIIHECGFSLSTFYYKLNKSKFKKLEILQIELAINNLKRL